MESIINDKKECYVCKTTQNLHIHHIMFGTANRTLSELYGLKVCLCGKHHNLSNEGVHFDKKLDTHLKQLAQKRFEYIHGHDKWMQVFGRNYL